MTTLSTNAAGELCLTLRGEAENCILAALRRWPHWQRATFERDPADHQRCFAVTLVTSTAFEPTVREILRRSFNLTFPVAGGTSELVVQEPVVNRKTRGRR